MTDTSALVPVTSEQDLKEIRNYEIFERLRNGETVKDIAKTLHMSIEHVWQAIKTLAQYAREHNRERTDLAITTIVARYEYLWNICHQTIKKPGVDEEVKVKTINLMIGINQRLTDLFQVGRQTAQVSQSIFVTGMGDPDYQDIRAAERLGIPIAKDF